MVRRGGFDDGEFLLGHNVQFSMCLAAITPATGGMRWCIFLCLPKVKYRQIFLALNPHALSKTAMQGGIFGGYYTRSLGIDRVGHFRPKRSCASRPLGHESNCGPAELPDRIFLTRP
jgi:hypothetical protein